MRIDARTLAAISGSCTHMMQDAAVSYYTRDDFTTRQHGRRVIEEFRRLAGDLGFELIEKKQTEAAE